MNFDVTTTNVVVTAVFGLLSAGITGLITYRTTNKKEDRSAQGELINQLMLRVDNLSNRISSLEEANEEQAIEIIELRSKNSKLEQTVREEFNHINIIKSYYTYMPKPAWLKSTDGLMFFVNDAYERQWGISRLKYEGQPDERVWPLEFAEEFKNNDETVIREMKGFSFIERVPNDPYDPKAGVSEWDVYKFPVVYKGELLGIGGVAFKRGM
jgi:PAS domain-containing protein